MSDGPRPLFGVDGGAPRVAVVRVLRGLGDLLCAVPTLRALRAASPAAHVTWVGASGTEWFATRFATLIDEHLVVPSYPGLPETDGDVGALPPFLAEAQGRRLDLALQLHGSGVVSNPLSALLGPTTLAGHHLPGQWCPDPSTFPVYPSTAHEVHRLLGVTRALGIPDCGDVLEFPLEPADRHERAELVAAGMVPAGGELACVHPGASIAARRWAPEAFAAVADALAARGLPVVLTGSADEAPITAAVAAAMTADAVDLAGRTSLGGLASVLDSASVLVTNDTGVSHLAAALSTPSVVVFLASDPARWAPLDAARHRIVDLGATEPDPVASRARCLGDGCVSATLQPRRARPGPLSTATAVAAVVAAADEVLSLPARLAPAAP